MVRRLTTSIALAAACVVGNAAMAQEATTKAVSAKPNVKMATYSSHYSAPAQAAPAQVSGAPQAMAFGRVWGGAASNRDHSRFNHYPYVYYPQNFKGNEYFRSSDSMYYRYPPEMQIPVYNRKWHNYYPNSRRFHWGHHFILDVF